MRLLSLNAIMLSLLLTSCQKIKDVLPSTKELQIKWDKSYGGSDSDYASSIVKTADGGLLLVGMSESADNSTTKKSNLLSERDIWVVKTDLDGTYIWDKSFTLSPNGRRTSSAGKTIATSDGGYLLTGTSFYSIGIIKIDGLGNELWRVQSVSNFSDFWGSIDIVETSDKSFFIFAGGLNECFVIKINSSGNVIWEKDIDVEDVNNTRIISVKNNSLLCMYATNNGNQISSFEIDHNGNILKQDIIRTSKEILTIQDIVFYSDGKYAMLIREGDEYSAVSTEYSNFIVGKFDSNSNQWSFLQLGAVDKEAFRTINILKSDKFVLGGYTYNGEPEGDSFIEIRDLNFKLESRAIFGGDGDDQISGIEVIGDNIYSICWSRSNMNTGTRKAKNFSILDYWLVKFSY
jgi:hypothetical protein